MTEVAMPHPDPLWWQRFPEATFMHPLQLCHYCSHIRALHEIGCYALCATIFDGRPCECTNLGTGSLYHDPLGHQRLPK